MNCKKLKILAFILMFSVFTSCSNKVAGPSYITSVLKDIPPGKIKTVKKGEVMAAMTHKFFRQNGGEIKHELLDCLKTTIVFKGRKENRILIDALYYKCSGAVSLARENYTILFKKPCVFRFETLMIQVVTVSSGEINYRIVRDRG